MTSDYQAIRQENERRYGTDIGRIGPMLLADRYDDRTHFIYELLQNAEDALAKRDGQHDQQSVHFHLLERELRISHFGKPFDEADVRGICGIAESTKDLTAIGRFGIGFKSVYALTDRPEVHSGGEHFAIESFVKPIDVPEIQRCRDETIIVIPLQESADRGEIEAGAKTEQMLPEIVYRELAGREEIEAGLQRLGPGALLFLREIGEIEWKVKDGPSGLYLRSQSQLDDHVRSVNVIGQAAGRQEIDQTWLVFSRPMPGPEGEVVGQVEIAFSLSREEASGHKRVCPVSSSPLVVFFPTVVETHLGFLVQGPYRTTPSRDNVPKRDRWNQKCIKTTADALADALLWIRDHDHYLLDVGALQCLPLDREKFGEDSMFFPLYEETKQALTSERLLPRFSGGYVAAGNAKLARTQELRGLFDPKQLAVLFDSDQELAWLSGDISQDRTPELRQYLRSELDIDEITPETILLRFNISFLEAQTDEWICRLYEFLNEQSALMWRISDMPLIRLEDGAHVPAHADGQPQAFLPSEIKTSFPTVRSAVCSSEAALAFLQALDLTKPDMVDDVIRNVLTKYHEDTPNITDDIYESDILRVQTAFKTDSQDQREKLITALRETPFIMAVDAGDESKKYSMPSDLYLATKRLKNLFDGIKGILLVDDGYDFLRGEGMRELFEACGVVQHLRPIEGDFLPWDERRELRGQISTSGKNDRVTDWKLHGLDDMLSGFTGLSVEGRQRKAKLLWEELAHLEERRGKGVFTGKYTWTYHSHYSKPFVSAFVRLLNESEWVPDADGNLRRSDLIPFESLEWKPDPFLQSKIRFKPPIIDQLAEAAGIEPGVLDLLKEHGITSTAELAAQLGLQEAEEPEDDAGGSAEVSEAEVAARLGLQETEKPEDDAGGSAKVSEAIESLLGDTPNLTPPVPDPEGADPVPAAAGGGNGMDTRGSHTGGTGGSRDGERQGRPGGSKTGSGESGSGDEASRPFISYVAVHPDEEADPDDLDQRARMALETKAINFILSVEPYWQRTPTGNPGFDLFAEAVKGQAARWCEVKAMTGSFADRPVGLSRTQFECARKHGTSYWVYVVEYAGNKNARIVRIQDPAGKARTFTFDCGWLNIAEVDSEQEHRED